MEGPRFLIIRLAALGDVAMSTALLSRIRVEHPKARVSWLCGSRVAPLVRMLPDVEVLEVDEARLLKGGLMAQTTGMLGVWKQLAGRRFDTVLVLHPDPRYRILTWPLLGARIVAASHGPGPNANPIPGRYRGDEAARLLDGGPSSGPLDQRFPLADLRAIAPKSSPVARVVLVPGGARNVMRAEALKRWPVLSYRALAEELLRSGREVTLIGDASDAEYGRHFDGLPVQNLIGKTSIPETLDVLAGAGVVVSHDTGPLHLARLVRAPIVALFGPTDPQQFVGADASITVLWGGADLACRPCYDGKSFARCADNICINRVSVREVLTAVEARLSEAPQIAESL